jgi:hypothetical protein
MYFCLPYLTLQVLATSYADTYVISLLNAEAVRAEIAIVPLLRIILSSLLLTYSTISISLSTENFLG